MLHLALEENKYFYDSIYSITEYTHDPYALLFACYSTTK